MKLQLRLSLVALSAAALACSVFVGGPDLPQPPVTASPEALQRLQSDIEAAVLTGLLDGTLRLSITQEQLTAFLASRLASQPDPILSEPQVVLGDQEMIIYGRAKSWIFEANVAVTCAFDIDETGRPHITITRAQMGPIPMPVALQDAIAATLDEALTGYVGPAALGFRLETIEISAGVMSVTGRIR